MAEIVSLDNLGRGAAVEKFDDELRKVLENILDPNTTLAAREVTLKVKLTPDETRGISVTDIVCSSKIAPRKPFRTTLFVGKDVDGVVATEPNPGQISIKGFKVTELKGGIKS